MKNVAHLRIDGVDTNDSAAAMRARCAAQGTRVRNNHFASAV